MANTASNVSKSPAPKSTNKKPLQSVANTRKTTPTPAASTGPSARAYWKGTMFTSPADAREYGMGCLVEARETLGKITAAVLIDIEDFDDAEFREFAKGMNTNFAGVEAALDALTAVDDSPDWRAGRATREPATPARAETPSLASRVREQISWIALAAQNLGEGHDLHQVGRELAAAMGMLATIANDADEDNSKGAAGDRAFKALFDKHEEELAAVTVERDLYKAKAMGTLPEKNDHLSKEVPRVVSEVKALEEEIREHINEAILAHIYIAGSCGGDCSNRYLGEKKDLDRKFTDGAAGAIAALNCIDDFLDELTAHTETESAFDAAAEE